MELGIYDNYDSSSIIKYLEPMIGDLFTSRFAYCPFDEKVFPPLGETRKFLKNDTF